MFFDVFRCTHGSACTYINFRVRQIGKLSNIDIACLFMCMWYDNTVAWLLYWYMCKVCYQTKTIAERTNELKFPSHTYPIYVQRAWVFVCVHIKVTGVIKSIKLNFILQYKMVECASLCMGGCAYLLYGIPLHCMRRYMEHKPDSITREST